MENIFLILGYNIYFVPERTAKDSLSLLFLYWFKSQHTFERCFYWYRKPIQVFLNISAKKDWYCPLSLLSFLTTKVILKWFSFFVICNLNEQTSKLMFLKRFIRPTTYLVMWLANCCCYVTANILKWQTISEISGHLS